MKLRTKLIRNYSVLIIVVYLFTAIASILCLGNLYIDITSGLLDQIFASKSDEISSWMHSCISRMEIIEQTMKIDNLDDAAIQSLVDNLNTSVGLNYGNDWGTFAIGNSEGIGYVGDGKYIDIHQRDYFIQAKQGTDKYILSHPVISKTDESSTAILHYPLRKGGEYTGYINAAISLQRLTEIITDIHFYDGKSFIMDLNGNVYAKDSSIDPDDLSNVRARLVNSSEVKVFRSDRYSYYFTKITDTDQWYLCTRVTTIELFKVAIPLFAILTVLFLITMYLTLRKCIDVGDSLSAPITQLNETMKNASIHLEGVSLQSDIEEISSLSESFNHLIEEVHNQMEMKEKNAKALRQSEIRILQSQINPHFLYNTLDALNWEAMKHDDTEMQDLIISLSDFYRISLSNGEEFIPIRDEIHHVQSYLNIQKTRFGNLFEYELNCDESLYDTYCLKVILQPLVENAIIHGIRPKGKNGKLLISLTSDGSTVSAIIQDNGVGMSEEVMNETLEGLTNESLHKYGLYNVNQRISLTYGTKYGLNIESTLNIGTKVTLTFPAKNIEE